MRTLRGGAQRRPSVAARENAVGVPVMVWGEGVSEARTQTQAQAQVQTHTHILSLSLSLSLSLLTNLKIIEERNTVERCEAKHDNVFRKHVRLSASQKSKPHEQKQTSVSVWLAQHTLGERN